MRRRLEDMHFLPTTAAILLHLDAAGGDIGRMGHAEHPAAARATQAMSAVRLELIEAELARTARLAASERESAAPGSAPRPHAAPPLSSPPSPASFAGSVFPVATRSPSAPPGASHATPPALAADIADAVARDFSHHLAVV